MCSEHGDERVKPLDKMIHLTRHMHFFILISKQTKAAKKNGHYTKIFQTEYKRATIAEAELTSVD